MRPTGSWVCVAALWVALTAACGDDETGSGGSGGAGGGGGGAGSTGTPPSTGSTGTAGTTTSGAGGDGGSVQLEMPTAGIDGCDPSFVDDDGVCRPSPGVCAPGTIPDPSVGCIPVGPSGCDPSFLDERGLCLPGLDACPAGSFPAPTLGCVSIDGEDGCGEGTWGAVDLQPGDVHVDDSYAGDDADGTRDRPFSTLAAALAAADDEARIVLAAGTYRGATIDRLLSIRGVCASQVTVAAEQGAPRVFTLGLPPGDGGEMIMMTDLTIEDEVAGILVTSGHALLQRIRVRGVSYKAIAGAGPDTDVMIVDSVVEDTTPGGSGDLGIGVQSSGGANVSVFSSAILRARTSALQAIGGSWLSTYQSFIGGTLPDPGGYGSAGAAVDGGWLSIGHSVVVANHGGLVGHGADSAISVTGSVLGATIDPTSGDQVTLDAGASATLWDSALVDSGSWAINSYDGVLELDGVLVADVADGPHGGAGVSAAHDATILDSTFTRIAGMAVGVGGRSRLHGVVIEDVTFSPQLGVGTGVLVGDDGDVIVERSMIRGTADFAVLSTTAGGAPGTLSVNRSLIGPTDGVDGGAAWGVGLGASAPAVPVVIDQTRFEGTRGAGVLVTSAEVALLRSVIEGVEAADLSGVDFPPGDAATGPIADGVLFHGGGGGAVSLFDDWIEGAARAGVTLSTAAHTLNRVRALGGTHGLALRDGATATREQCDFEGSSAAIEDPSTLVVPPVP